MQQGRGIYSSLRREREVEADLEDDSEGLKAFPGSLTSEHLEHDATKGPDVNLRGVASALIMDDLRSHPLVVE
jgi:hypothetical protein